MINKDTFHFYLILTIELLFSPWLYLYEELKKLFSKFTIKKTRITLRTPIHQNIIYIGIHEWGGYPLSREKQIKHGTKFTCGLQYQLERFNTYKGKYNIDITLTLSDANIYQNKDFLKGKINHLLEVSNKGFDFSGYANFYRSIKNKKNSYVILSNSSINSIQDEFLDSYIEYFENNLDIGILGVSYCTKRIQSLIRNNFTPHIQSFFYLTTIETLNKIVQYNHNSFPGEGITHKLLLIRKGEIKMSQIALNLGYSLAVVLEDGDVYKFRKKHFLDNGYHRWTIHKGELRQHIKTPNKINPIQ